MTDDGRKRGIEMGYHRGVCHIESLFKRSPDEDFVEMKINIII